MFDFLFIAYYAHSSWYFEGLLVLGLESILNTSYFKATFLAYFPDQRMIKYIKVLID